MYSGYDVQEVLSFNQWLSEQCFKHRVVCGGNHDRYFEAAPQQARVLLTNAIYLESTGITIDNITFWASPCTPEFTSRNFTIDDLIARGVLTVQQAELLATAIQRGDNLLISGATSSGKPTLLNMLASFILDQDRI